MIFRVSILLLLFVIASPLVTAASVKLREQSGKVHAGNIELIRGSWVYIRLADGNRESVAIQSLDTVGKRLVQSWISKRGGTEKYTSWIGTKGDSFSKSWPKTTYGPSSIQLKRVQNLSKKQPLIYESTHYRFILDSKAEAKVVKQFAVLFEATYKYVLSLPINASAHYLDSKDKFSIYLFKSFDAYHRAGGPNGSAGVYMSKNKSIMVPMPVLGVSWDGRRWGKVKKYSNSVLSHELTHQLTDGVNFGSWYIEGSAEYVATTRYTHGAYHTSNARQRAFKYVRAKGGLKDGSGRRLGSRVKLMNLEQFMNLPYSTFAGGEANKNYGIGLLLTYYFYHKDGRGDAARIKQYIKALQQGAREKEAQKLLLGNRTYLQLQEDFRRYCAQGGIALEFAK